MRHRKDDSGSGEGQMDKLPWGDARGPNRLAPRVCGARFSVQWWHSCHHSPDVDMNVAAAR